jgi:hypothetical protein
LESASKKAGPTPALLACTCITAIVPRMPLEFSLSPITIATRARDATIITMITLRDLEGPFQDNCHGCFLITRSA